MDAGRYYACVQLESLKLKNSRQGWALLATVGGISAALAAWFLGTASSSLAAPAAEPSTPVVALASAVVAADPAAAAAPKPGMSAAEFASSDPVAFSRWAQEQFREKVQDYRCIFSKQERVNGKLSALQKMEIRYRKSPEAIYLIWTENADEARRALYIPDDPKFRDSDGSRMARVEPAGSIARMFVTDIMIDIDGARAKKTSRRTIADVGFAGTYRLLEQYNRTALDNNELDFRYVGPSTVAGRASFQFERYVPENKVDGVKYVDARMIMHIDQEWFVPLAIYSYADHAGKKLLGQYMFSEVNVHPNFTAKDFEF